MQRIDRRGGKNSDQRVWQTAWPNWKYVGRRSRPRRDGPRRVLRQPIPRRVGHWSRESCSSAWRGDGNSAGRRRCNQWGQGWVIRVRGRARRGRWRDGGWRRCWGRATLRQDSHHFRYRIFRATLVWMRRWCGNTRDPSIAGRSSFRFPRTAPLVLSEL